ncbi:amino acid adenylation domain-containing protein [Streptomyces sp. NPDC039016]|uniref:amino acid adenylation domain-containing protein n=1 Tax=Streptomyces sp. NPDC039016 TaxID=3154330 RepID=UPI0033C21B87
MEPGTSPAGAPAATGDALAADIARTLTRVLGEARPDDPPATPDTALRRLGLDSMTAARLWLAVQQEHRLDVPLRWLAEAPTLADYARRVAALATGDTRPEPGPGAPSATADPAARHQPFPLTPLQEAYLSGREPELTADAIGCHLYREFDLPALDAERLRTAWQRLVDHHDMLRAVLTDDGRQQIRATAPSWTPTVHDTADRAAFTARAAEVRERLAHRHYPAGQWPPFTVEVTRRADGGGRIHLSIDALITDGQGLDLLTAQWQACYDDPRHTLPAPATGLTVRDCATALDAARHTPGHRRDLDHWVDRIRRLPGAPDLFTDAPEDRPDGMPCLRRTTRTAALPPAVWQALQDRAAALEVSPTALVLTVFTEALARQGAHRPYALVVTTSRRPHLPPEADQLVGPFTGTALVEAVLPYQHPFDEAARLTHRGLWDALEHSGVCAVAAGRELRARDRGRGPAPLPVVFTSMLDPAGRPRDRGFAARTGYAVSQTTGIWLDHQMWEQDGALHLRWDTADARFTPGTADAAFAALCNGLRAAALATDPTTRLLNDLQQAYFVPRATAEPGPWRGCQVVTSYDSEERIDPVRLSAAVTRLAAAYDVLRSAVTHDGTIEVCARAPEQWTVPVTGPGPDGAAPCPDAVREAMAAAPFPLGRHPQFEVRVTRGTATPHSEATGTAGAGTATSGTDTVHLAVDLTLADARSIHLIGRELMRLYADPAATPRPVEPRTDEATAPPADPDHWPRRLRDLPPGIPVARTAPDGTPPRRIRLQAAPLAWQPFADRCAAHGLSPDAVLFTAFCDALARRHGTGFALPVVRWDHTGDRHRPAEHTALSWLPCPPPALPFTARARHCQDTLDQDRAVPTSGLPELRRTAARTGTAGHPVVYTSVLDLTDRPLPPGSTAGPWLSCTPDVTLDCITTVDAGLLHLAWDAVEPEAPTDGWDEAFAAYTAAVRRLATDDAAWDGPAPDAPRTAPAQAPAAGALTDAELHTLLHTWNDTAHDFPADRLMHQPFEEQAAQRPDAEALRWRGGTMTYRELNRRANRLARELRTRGVGPETVVAVSVPRGPMMIAAVLGVLKAGGCYLPMEPYLPAERAAVILEEAAAALVVTTEDRNGWPVPDGVDRLCATAATRGPHPADADDDPDPATGPQHTAYIIFTSGSTGRPKGVAVAHRPVLNLLNWCHRTFDFGPHDMGLCVTSLGFDLSVFDVFGLLGRGAALYLADEEQQRDPALLLDVLLDEPVTFWNSAPTTLAQIGPLLGGRQDAPGTGDLRLVFLSGDYTPLSLPDEIRAVFPRADLISLGGATEATVWSNWFRIGAIDPEWRSIPYGKPIDNCRYHVLDAQLRPCPVGVEGDLYIGGECLALGYVNQPTLTAERFLPDPFRFRDDPDERLYKTGDRACYFPDGNLCFLGRADGQVKIRGFRVELAEIEHRLRAHEAVKEAVVLAREDGCGDRKLVGYVVPRPGAACTGRDLRAFAAQALPEYMIPNFLGFLTAFPATANGKLDRSALPWPLTKDQLTGPTAEPAEPAEPAGTPEAAAAPAGGPDRAPAPRPTGPSHAELCAEVARLFAEALGVPSVDSEADLWDQGATSFTMVRVSGALQRAHRQRVPVSALLDEPTVSGIARWVRTHLLGAAEPGPESAAEPAPAPAAAPEPVPAPAPEPVPAPASVDFFSAEDRDRFKRQHWNRRPEEPDSSETLLDTAEFEAELYDWRASRRDFGAGPVPYADFCRLLSLLRAAPADGSARALYPSAGDTYAVQVYLHLTPDAVDGLGAGLYYYDPDRHALRLLDADGRFDGRSHFYYNRPVFERSRFGVYLFGQRHGIEPLYGDESLRYLTLESGYMGQLLLMGQAACGIGLCPIGALNTDGLRARLGLDEGHVFLQAFLGGAAAHPERSAAGTRPVFADPEPTGPAAEEAEPAAAAPTAVIGMAGRFPGADDLDAFWDDLLAGRDAVRPLPATRTEAAPPGAAATGGFLDDIDRFDSLRFHIAPQEAGTVDPQARLMLHTVWQCLEDAGHTAGSLRESAGRVGVFIGAMWHDHRQQGADHWADGGPAHTPATASDIANRVSHFFDFRGPSLAVDTSCSSSLAALHLAVASLRRGECGAAVVGAVNLLGHPYHWGLLDGLELLATGAPRGAYAADGSGWHPGEGAGVLLLRPAAAAERARDTVHGLIEGTRIAHAGRAPRYGAPRTEALTDSLARALADAGVTPDDIDYVECAAAGAGIADAAELEALGSVLARGADVPPVPVGTLKPNIGHLEAASGISQLIKVLLQMRHGTLAPTLVAADRSPLVDWQGLPVEVVDRPRTWPVRAADGRATALVNAVGATGSYGHALIRAPHRDVPAGDRADRAREAAPRPPAPHGPRTVVLSAESPAGLADAARRLRDHLATTGRHTDPDDLAWTLQTGRVPLASRLTLDADGLDGVRAGLTAFLDGRSHPGLATGTADPAPAATGPDAAPDPATAAADWLRGHPVDFARLWTVPARRIPLPVRALGGERHRLAPERPAEPRQPTPSRPTPSRAAPTEPVAAPPTAPTTAPPTAAPAPAERYVLDRYADASGIPADRLHPRVPLENYGLSSHLVSLLNDRFEREIGGVSPTVLYEYPDLAGVAGHLARHHRGPWAPAAAPHQDAAPGTAAPGTGEAAMEAPGTDDPGTGDPIAIIGIAGRYPQAPDLDRFWRNLVDGRDCVGPLPAERAREGWPTDLMWGGFLDGVDRFDPLLFGISPRDAQLMDPQERQFLEVAWETLEDAGCTRAAIRDRLDSRVGVFVGTMYNEYPFFGVERSLLGEPADTGSAVAGIANRVSYFLDLHGPSLAVDTMCSSSLTALHLAVASLRRGECAAALVGGVNLSLHPHKFRQQARLKMASADHRCRSFGAGGDGFVPAEGVGAVLLKPLSAARADGDRIHAVIRATAVNHGGKTNGYMVPNPVAQGELVRTALRRAGVEPSDLGYLEAHGTGTELGDPVEINGLTRAFDGAPPTPGSCAIGSVKSNIGHAEAAAGMAGLAKVVLQLRHRTLVPSLHSRDLNPAVDWAGSSFHVPQETRPWDARRGPDGTPLPRRAGISSFGAGGANAHVVVEEYLPAPAAPAPAAPGPQLIVLSAHDEGRLRALAARLRDHLAKDPGGAPPPALADVAHTLQSGREPLRERLAVVVHDLPELVGHLDRFAGGAADGPVHDRTPGAAHPEGPPAAPEPGADPVAELWRLARHWTRGGAVDWSALHPARPRLTALPSYPFAGHRYWLPEPRQPLAPPAAPARPEIPLHACGWEPVPGPRPTGDVPGRTLCLFAEHSEPLARTIAELLGPERVLLVREGADAGDGVPAFASEREAARIINRALAQHPDLTHWLDLTDLGRPALDGPGPWTCRLLMLQRLVRQLRRTGCRILQVTGGLYDLPGPAPTLAGARLAGFVRMLGAEYGKVAATVLDLDPAADPADTARQVLAELAAPDAPHQVCLRDGVRHRPALAELPAADPGPLRCAADRAYLVTGGTRGIGALVARLLVRRGARRIALTGGRTLPPRTRWAGLDPRTPEGATAALVAELEGAGAHVLLHSGPLSDRDRTARFLTEVRHTLGPLGGIVHCAGRGPLGRPSFVGKDLADFAPVLEPKTTGLTTLAELCAADRPEFFVLFSSLSALAPALAVGVGDYSAANAFLDSFAAHQARSGRPWFRSVVWPTWSEAGMGAAQPDGCAAAGVGPLTDEDGLRVLERVLQLPPEHVRVVPCPPLDGVPADPRALLGHPAQPAPAPEPTTSEEETAVRTTPDHGLPSPAAPPWLAPLFSELLAIPEDDLDPTELFGDLGVESVMLGELLERIEEKMGRPLDPGTLLDHPTLDRLGPHLAALGAPMTTGPAADAAPAPSDAETPAAPAATAAPAPAPEPPAAGPDKIAVIGLAGRFPGAPDVAAFWENLLAGACAVDEVPVARWDTAALYSPDHAPGRSISKWGGFLDGIEEFDPEYFRMTDDEARCLDPAVRLFLEGSAQCLADAGYRETELAGRDVGVFAGARMSGYGRRAGDRRDAVGMGSDQNFIAARVAHHYDLHGPNLVVDSACSSSLVALQLACRSLRDGESELALAGGVDILLDEEPYLDFSAARALSRRGRCATFDERADGFVPGEGCGVVLLKPLAAALRDGDRIHAVIDAVAVNNDGRTMGLTTPNPAAQAKVVRRALAAGGRDPEDIGLIEAHGTGTMIGDPIELRALTEVFREATDRTGFCAIGSVKSNVGHLLSAAGMAGFLKAVLAVREGRIPPTLFCDRPNPRFDFAASPFRPARTALDWTPEGGRVRAAGVSAFGLGGTNAHVITSQLDPALAARHTPRPALPDPRFRRRRLWLEKPAPARPAGPPPEPAADAAPAPAPRRPLSASILGLRFAPAPAGPAPTTAPALDTAAATQEGQPC